MKKMLALVVLAILISGCSPAYFHPVPTWFSPTPKLATVTPSLIPISGDVMATPVLVSVENTPTPPAQPTPRILAPGEWKTLPVVPAVSDTARDIYQRGLEMGNDPTHFSKVGDCQNVSTFFLAPFDESGNYSLGVQYDYLTPTIDYYAGSWARESLAVKGGYNVAAVLSPLRSNPDYCEKGESPLACEIRIWKPSIVIISMETWWGQKPAEDYEKYMRQVLDYVISQGAVPILATKADNLEKNESINAVIAKLAVEYDIPLWNFWAAVQPLPNRGLTEDNFHLTFAGNYFDDDERMLSAWPWRNLTALQSIDAVYNGLK